MNQFSELPPVLSAAQMREADRITKDEIGISGFTLMESAGREIAEVAQEMIELGLEARSTQTLEAEVICLCGKGNNGGDGFVAARYLSANGHRVRVVLMAEQEAYSGDALEHLLVLSRLSKSQSVTIENFTQLGDGLAPDLIVDALLGTGLNSPVTGAHQDVMHWMNGQSAPILSVDVPSGLSADTGMVMGVAARAHVTVSLAALKTGLLINAGPEYVGALHVVDIGIPPIALKRAALDSPHFLSSDVSVASQLPAGPSRSDHKYASGPTLVVGGSSSFSGAPVLASLAAARVGSKYVVCIGPEEIRTILAEKLTEIPVEAWEAGANEAQLDALIERLDTRWSKAKALLIGPGLGRSPSIKNLVMHVLARFNGPVVIDADALFALQDERDWVKQHSKGQWVFTPHAGEFGRLLGHTMHTVAEEDLLESARALAAEWNVVLLLKGQPSITALPSGEIVFNSTGNPAAGTAGAGDVLAGMVAGFLAQGLMPAWSAICGIHLAGTAADLYVEEHASGSLMAGDILNLIPRALLEAS